MGKQGTRIPIPSCSSHPTAASPRYRNPLSAQTSSGGITQRHFPKPTAGRAGGRCPMLGSRPILPGAEPLGRILFALGEDSQSPFSR